jgi:hypothetical protein
MSYLNKVVNIYEAKGAKDPKDLFADLKAKPVNTDGAGTRDKPMKNDNPLPDAQHNNPRAAKQAKKDVKTPRTQQKDSNDPNVKPASLKNDHTEYKRMGVMMAEALGYEIDEAMGAIIKKGLQVGAGMAKKAGEKAVGAAANVAKQAGQKAVGAAMNKADAMAEKMKKKKEAQQAGAPNPGMEKPGMQVAHTEYKRIGNLMAEIFGLREEDDNPTETDVAKANKDVHTKKGVKGETAKETKAVDKEIDKAMGPAKKGAAGGIDAMKEKIRAAGAAARGR